MTVTFLPPAAVARAVLLQAASPEDPKSAMTAWVLALLLVGVAIVGLLLMAGVIVWGGRLRRDNRRPLPDAPEPDPYAAMRSETRRNRRGRDDGDAAPDDDLL